MKPDHITFLCNLASDLDIFMPRTAEILTRIANEEMMANLGVSPLDFKKQAIVQAYIAQTSETVQEHPE